MRCTGLAAFVCPSYSFWLSIVFSGELLIKQAQLNHLLPWKAFISPGRGGSSSASPQQHFLLSVYLASYVVLSYLLTHLSPHWAPRNLSEGIFFIVYSAWQMVSVQEILDELMEAIIMIIGITLGLYIVFVFAL